MNDLLSGLNLGLLILIFAVTFLNFRKKTGGDLEGKLSEKFNSQQLAISKLVSDSSNESQVKISLVHSQIDKLLATGHEQQKTQFEGIKLSNQQKLSEIQESLTKKLTENIENLVRINRENFELLNRANSAKLDQINLDVQKRLDENFARNLKSFEEMNKNLGQMEEKAKQMIESTKSIDKLNTIFARTSSKAFGGFAENYLENILSQYLDQNSWAKQVKVPTSSEIIDFVIYLEDKKIGIDAKFPLTKYQDYIDAENSDKAGKLNDLVKSVLEMAKSISTKYYHKDFLDVLLLYIPSEGLHLEILNSPKSQEFLEELNSKNIKVSLISPNTILPMLLTLQNYQRRQQITQQADFILRGLKSIHKNIFSFKEEYRKLGDKLRQAQQNYEVAERNLLGVENQIELLEAKEGSNSEYIENQRAEEIL